MMFSEDGMRCKMSILRTADTSTKFTRRNKMPIRVSTDRHRSVKKLRSLRSLLRPLDELARGSDHLFAAHLGYNDSLGIPHGLPRYLFAGPGEKGSYLRVGLFAGVHGDEESGVLATAEFLE